MYKILIITLLLCANIGMTQAQDTDLDAIMSEAIQLFYAGKYNETITLLQSKQLEFEAAELSLYSKYLSWLGHTYMRIREFREAEKSFLKAKEALETSARETTDYASIINSLGAMYRILGDYPKAETFFIEGKSIYEKIEQTESLGYANVLNSMGVLYSQMEDYERTETYYLSAKKIWEKTLEEPDNVYIATVLYNLGHIYHLMADYVQAETYFLEAQKMQEKLSGKENTNYATTISALGALYYDLGDYGRAETYMIEGKFIREKIFGKENPNYALSLHNIGELYRKTKDYEKAEEYFLETKSIREKTLGKEHPLYTTSLIVLGTLYLNKGDYQHSNSCFLEAKTIRENANDNESIDYANILNNLGWLYSEMGDYAQAEIFLLEAKAIFEKRLGKEHPRYSQTLRNLGHLYLFSENYLQAQATKIEADKITRMAVENNFSFMSERQRALFWDKNRGTMDFTNFHVFTNPAPAMTMHAYDNALFTKGLLLRTTNGIRDAIYSSNNDDLILQYEQLGSVRRSITALQSAAFPNHAMIATLETRADSLDKIVTAASATFKEFNKDITLRWSDVREMLKEDEAAIEFVHFNIFDKKVLRTDTIMYGALILRKNSPAPVWIPLFDEQSLQRLVRRQNHDIEEQVQSLYSGKKGDSLYRKVWQPLVSELQGIKTIYYSPSGMLHQIAFAAIPSHDGLLTDKYDLQRVSSTREIASITAENQKTKKDIGLNPIQNNAVVFGGLFYDVESDLLIAEAQKYNVPVSFASLPRSIRRDSTWRYLPGSLIEAERIVRYFDEHNIPNRLYSEASGTEEAFKSISGTATEIVHLATHGFFIDDFDDMQHYGLVRHIGGSDRSRFDNPLLRSGLLLAGSNRAWKGEQVIEGIDDGVLTAEEISQMNITGTKLVVLSACNTGLGEAQTAEGVFGLQRAFKLAGAETIVMSLWEVPDDATTELMTAFYSIWLSGKTKREAFAEAQRIVRDEYGEAFTWAGFVMVD